MTARRDLRTQRQLRHAVCAALNCRRRKDLVRTRAMIWGLLIEIDLCREHESELHAVAYPPRAPTAGGALVTWYPQGTGR
jgi:hypothetical protein